VGPNFDPGEKKEKNGLKKRGRPRKSVRHVPKKRGPRHLPSRGKGGENGSTKRRKLFHQVRERRGRGVASVRGKKKEACPVCGEGDGSLALRAVK